MEILEKFSASETLLLDYDGLIVDSEELYLETWLVVLDDVGKEICKNFDFGLREEDVYKLVCQYLILDDKSLKSVSEFRKKHYNELVRLGRLNLIRGVDLLINYFSRKFELIVVSNSELDVVLHGLNQFSLADKFAGFICYAPNKSPKPDPYLYKEAISKFNLNSKKIIAFEDSISGLMAATRAGIPVVGVSSGNKIQSYCKDNYLPYFPSHLDLLSKLQSNDF